MNRIRNYIYTLILIIIIILLFKYSYIINNSVIDGFYLWLYKVFPSLFIMFILNDIIINTNILNNISKSINPLFNRIFNTSNNSFEVFILSLFSGTPSSAFIIKEMLEKNKLDIGSANKLISFTFFSNPLFLYNILSITFNKYITIKIILIHYLSNIFIGLLLRNKYNTITINSNNDYKNNNILYILPNSIKKSINTLLMILRTIIFYMIITNILLTIINLNNINIVLLKGLLEITQSLNMLNIINYKSIIKEIIAISIISFGGMSIHTQVLSLISNTNISYKNFFIGRILHVLTSTFTYIMCTIIFTS